MEHVAKLRSKAGQHETLILAGSHVVKFNAKSSQQANAHIARLRTTGGASSP
jgi:hypothetical protein